MPRYQRKEEPFFRVGPLEKAGLAKESECCIEAPSPKRVKDRRRRAGDRPFTSTLPLQANSPLHAMHSVMVNDFANDFNLQSTSVPIQYQQRSLHIMDRVRQAFVDGMEYQQCD